MYSFSSQTTSLMALDFEEDIIWEMKRTHENRRRINADISLTSFKRPASSMNLKYLKETLIQTMATLVPNEVITNIPHYTPIVFDGCLLSGKISGMMEHLDIYEKTKTGAAHRMTRMLNRYLGSVLGEILTFDGDILSLTPDTFLVLWKSTTADYLSYFVYSAINCALVVQKKFKKFIPEVGVVLKVQMAITAGALTFCMLTNYERSTFLYLGQPMDELEVAEEINSWGDLIVAPSAWQLVNPAEYTSVPAENEEYHKILGVGLNWKCIGKEQLLKKDSVFETMNLSQISEENLAKESDYNFLRRTEDFSLRPILNDLPDIKEDLSKFLIAPLLTVLQDEDPLASLEEIRQVIVMYLNVTMQTANVDYLEVLNHCYKIVCKQAKEYNGLVTKSFVTQGFITFKVIFGVRGFTSVLESQEALRCAVKCHHDLDLFDEVQAVSISCTTGKCYCGVFGHSLRQAYAIFGRSLFKSAQMVVEHTGKVTCDRSTFIYSNLDSNSFTLLDQENEDVENGPVYEYKEEHGGSTSEEHAEMLPMLGRDEEIETFLKYFKVYTLNFGIKPCCNVAKCSFKNAILFEGVYKQGKSRLLQELKGKVGGASVQMITFYENDSMSSYNGARQIMRPTLGFGNYTAEYFRRKRIKEKMGTSATPNLLHVLNDVFDVNFPAPRHVEETKSKLMRDSIKILCTKCFEKPTLILVDNAECMDEDTWNLLIPMLETKRFFLVATFDGTKKDLANVQTVLESHHIERVVLKMIPQICLAGLVCQILKVYAIPADLEKVIQSNSQGNPGWIENFLLILQQTKKIAITMVDFKSIHDMSLVAPPLYMLKRLSPECVQYYKKLLEEKTQYPSEVTDPWHIYIDSCRDAFRDVDVRGGMQEIFCEETKVPVCLFTGPFDPKTDVDPNVTDDLNFLEMYDKLSYQEQLVLRCASVLGDPFTRRLLFFIWLPETEKKGAEVLQGLFEKDVLCCARGDFSSGGDYLLVRDRFSDPAATTSVECQCVGLDIHDSCIFMPKYASCGCMCFKSSKFAGTAYDLIPEGDRRELHSRAAKFIQKETRRCVSCGCGYFPSRFGCKMDSSTLGRVQLEVEKKKTVHLEHMDFKELFDYSTHMSGRTTISRSVERGPRATLPVHFRNTKSMTMSDTSEDRFIDLTYEDKHSKNMKFLSPLKILKLRRRTSLVRTFSKSDFLSCDCHLILNHMYKMLKRHYKGCGEWHEMIISCIHYARISMSNKNFASAMRTIEEALDILENKQHILRDQDWKIRMLTAKFYCLKGNLFMELDQVEDAIKTFLKAMKTFGLPFPENENNLSFHLKLQHQKWRQKVLLYFLPSSFLNEETDLSQLYISNSIAETLTNLCSLHMAKGKWKLAELAAHLSLQYSLQTETNLIRISEAFSNMILIAQHFKNNLMVITLEVHALRYCHKKRNYVEAPELKAISSLYMTIFEVRMARAEFEAALHMGYIVVSIATKCNEMYTTINLFALISVILVERLIINDATLILRELEYFADEIDNNSGRTWYFGLAVSFHLETGYIFSPFSIIELYYNGDGCSLGDKFYEANLRLVVTMWVWYLRNNQWETASLFSKKSEACRKRKIDSNNQAITQLYLLEGTLLTLVHKINKRSIAGMIEWKKEVERMLKKLHDASSSRKFIKAKLYLLEAYYSYILEDADRTKKLLKTTRKQCMALDNKLVLFQLDHSEKAWKNEMSTAARDFWRNHSSNETYISHHEIEFENLKLYSFTYPKPNFRI